MRVALLCTPSARHTTSWVPDQLVRLGHAVDGPTVVDDLAAAATTGHALTDAWGAGNAPDVALALGWEAGLAAQVASREHAVPVVVRLTRVGREPGNDRRRLETAVARGSALVLVPSVGELDRLVDAGVPRSAVQVLPDAVDGSRFSDDGTVAVAGGPRVAVAAGAAGPTPGLARGECVRVSLDQPDELLASQLRSCDAMVVTDDSEEEVALALRAMACGVPLVAVDSGVLADLVADEVTGLLVQPAVAGTALQSLLGDPMRRESMGLAAVDRVRARFDTAVVGAALDRVLRDVAPPAVAAAS